MSTNLYDLPADAMVRCIATIISAPEIYSSGARLSQAMAVFRTCKRMHAVLRCVRPHDAAAPVPSAAFAPGFICPWDAFCMDNQS